MSRRDADETDRPRDLSRIVTWWRERAEQASATREAEAREDAEPVPPVVLPCGGEMACWPWGEL